VFGGTRMAIPLLAYGVVILLRPQWWMLLLPALWPVADLTRWTGQMHVTESDALLLATVSVLSLRALIRREDATFGGSSPFRAGLAAWTCMLLLAVVSLLGIARGMSEFPPVSFDAWTGYSGSMNAVRVGKGFLLPLLLLPFLHESLRRDGEGTFRRLALGLALGLGTASLAALWERAAFPGLTDFAADYRTTALFWEMHVGGAAFDGWLVLTLPFAVYTAWTFRQSGWWMPVSLGILAIGSYAILTTFSRALYFAVAVEIAVLGPALLFGRAGPKRAESQRGIAAIVAVVVATVAVAMLAFRHGGYRGATALLLAAGLAYALVGHLRGLPISQVAASFGVAAFLYVAGSWTALLLPKGPYLVFMIAWSAGALIAWRLAYTTAGRASNVFALALFWWVLGAGVEVAVHWGGSEALPGTSIAALLIGAPALTQAVARQGFWRPSGRGLMVIAVIGVASLVAAAVFGSYFFQARASTASVDFDSRLRHWRHSASLPKTDAETWFGLGAGRFSEAYFWNVPDARYPGTWRVAQEDGNAFLRLGPPRHSMGFGELFRVTQAAPLDVRGPFMYRMRARAPADTTVRFEVCHKHLLYADDCLIRAVNVRGGRGWQAFEGVTEAGALSPGSWYAPRLASVSLDLDGPAAADVDDLEIVDGTGRSIVRNGDFGRGPEFWFFSSDRFHLPWHAKNMALHTYLESGFVGLAALAAVCILALARASRTVRSDGLLGGTLLASLFAFLTLGIFDSLVDVPRLSVWFVIVLWMSLTLRGGQNRGTGVAR
jgi:hypothetical protein